jgi:hypothetical protein
VAVASLAASLAASFVAILAIGLPAPATAADGPTASDLRLIIVGNDDGVPDLLAQLRDILSNPPLPLGGRIDTARAGSFRAGDLFSLASPDARRPTAWVIIESQVVHIRAAGAGRAQFVFRDITISQPMTDLDRERVGQTLRSALTVVIEGSPGGMGRGDAQRAVEYEEPLPPFPPAPGAAPSPQPQPQPQPPPAPLPGNDNDLQFRLGGFFEVTRIQSQFAYGPGVSAGLDLGTIILHPGVWIRLLTYVPDWMNSNSTVSPYSSSLRAGIGANVPGTSALRLELGLGWDFNRPGYVGSGDDKIPVYRATVRIGPTNLAGVNTSLSAFLEEATHTFDSGQSYQLGGPTTRGGLAVELWWL